jgi:hypothetical protein
MYEHWMAAVRLDGIASADIIAIINNSVTGKCYCPRDTISVNIVSTERLLRPGRDPLVNSMVATNGSSSVFRQSHSLYPVVFLFVSALLFHSCLPFLLLCFRLLFFLSLCFVLPSPCRFPLNHCFNWSQYYDACR